MNNSKTNTVLLLIIIVLLAVGLYVLTGKKESIPAVVDNSQSLPSEDTNTAPIVKNTTAPVTHNPSVITTLDTSTGWTRVMEESGMSALVPQGYSYNMLVPNALVGHGVVLNITYNNKNVVSITKFSNQVYFNEDIPRSGSTDQVLTNSNYPISGMAGMYYKGGTGIGDLIAVPSKFVTVYIDSPADTGISQNILDKIVQSIQI